MMMISLCSKIDRAMRGHGRAGGFMTHLSSNSRSERKKRTNKPLEPMSKNNQNRVGEILMGQNGTPKYMFEE